MTPLAGDLNFALRRLARSPGFALTAIVLLAFAFAANACVFSEAWCLLYKPLPFAHPEQLVSVGVHWTRENQDNPMSSVTLQDVAAKAQTTLIIPPPALCTDNGAMIAWAGAERMALGLTDTMDAAPRARWLLDANAAAPAGFTNTRAGF